MCEFKGSLFQQPVGSLDNSTVRSGVIPTGGANCPPFCIWYGKRDVDRCVLFKILYGITCPPGKPRQLPEETAEQQTSGILCIFHWTLHFNNQT